MEYPISSKTWVEVNEAKLRSNFASLTSTLPSSVQSMAVIKSNAYGHGILECARIFSDCGCDWLAVDDILEAVMVRDAGITTPLLVLGATMMDDVQLAIDCAITITISTIELAQYCADLPIDVHLKLDTGLGRQGFTPQTLPDLLQILSGPHSMRVTGIFSHLAAAELSEYDDATRMQYEQLVTMSDSIMAITGPVARHIAASAASIAHGNDGMHIARFGISLYGLWPSDDTMNRSSITLEPALNWYSSLSEVKPLPRGHTVGYDKTHTLDRDSIVAVIPLGYWHGIARAAGSRGWVLVHGKRAPIIGRVSMGMMVIDVTDIPDVHYGTVATIVGDGISAQVVGDFSGTIHYEVVTTIHPGIERRYQ